MSASILRFPLYRLAPAVLPLAGLLVWSGLMPAPARWFAKYVAEGAGLFAFYPLLFLPYFMQFYPGVLSRLKGLGRGSRVAGRSHLDFAPLGFPEVAFFAAGFLLMLLGILSGTPSLRWVGGILLLFNLLDLMGLHTGWRGRFLILLLPPFTVERITILSFPLRLFLSKSAGQVLKLLDPGASVSGNLIFYNDQEYLVDPACEGLKMFFALALLLLLVFERRRRLGTNLRPLLFSLPILGALWLMANLVRIIILTMGSIAPEDPLHDAVGIFSFIAFVLFPVLLLDFLLNQNTISAAPTRRGNSLAFTLSGAAFFCGGLFLLLTPLKAAAGLSPLPTQVGPFAKYELSLEGLKDTGIGTYRYKQSHLILKTHLSPLRLGHHPRLCWKAVGYRLLEEREVQLKGFGRVREALLEREGQRLHTIWWYGPSKTMLPAISSEIDWRIKALNNPKLSYTLYNLAAPTRPELNRLRVLLKKTVPGD